MSADKSVLNSTELSDFRKLGAVNWVVRIALALGVGAIAYMLLPYGVSIVENIFQITLGLGKTFLIGVPLFFAASFLWANRTLLKKMRESLSRKLWEWFIYNDPLDYIQGVIDDFKVSYGIFLKAIEKMRAAADELRMVANELIDEANGDMDRAKAIMADEKDEQKANLYAYYSTKRMDSTEDIVASYTEIEDNIEVMGEVAKAISIRIDATEFDLKMMNLNLRVSNTKRSAAMAAQSVLDNNSVEAAHMEFARNAYKQQLAAGNAVFKQFMARAKPILEADHIDQVISTEKGRKILDEFRKGVDIGGLKSFEEQLEAFKAKSEIFKTTTARDRVQNQRPEAARTTSSTRFSKLS